MCSPSCYEGAGRNQILLAENRGVVARIDRRNIGIKAFVDHLDDFIGDGFARGTSRDSALIAGSRSGPAYWIGTVG